MKVALSVRLSLNTSCRVAFSSLLYSVDFSLFGSLIFMVSLFLIYFVYILIFVGNLMKKF